MKFGHDLMRVLKQCGHRIRSARRTRAQTQHPWDAIAAPRRRGSRSARARAARGGPRNESEPAKPPPRNESILKKTTRRRSCAAGRGRVRRGVGAVLHTVQIARGPRPPLSCPRTRHGARRWPVAAAPRDRRRPARAAVAARKTTSPRRGGSFGGSRLRRGEAGHPRLRREDSVETGRGDTAAMTWRFRGGDGREGGIPRRRDAAAATWRLRLDEARRRRGRQMEIGDETRRRRDRDVEHFEETGSRRYDVEADM